MVNIPRWQIVLVIAVCVIGVAFAAPNLFSRQFADSLPDWLPHKQISLGLDLQGGSHLLLEVKAGVIIEEERDSVVDELRTQLRAARLGYTGLGIQGTSVSFRVRDPADIPAVTAIIDDVVGQLSASGGIVGDLLGGVGQQPMTSFEVVSTDDGQFRLTLTEQMIIDRKNRAIEQSLEVIRRRIDELGTREPTIQRQGTERIIVEVPGVENPEDLKGILQAEAKLTFHLVDHAATNRDRPPPGSISLPGEDLDGSGQPINVIVKKRVVVSGDRLVDAQPTIGDGGRPVVSFRFDTVGARKFGDATQANVGRQLAIVLDRKVISAPVIRDAILGGSGVISGSFTVRQTQELSILLRAGALPAPLNILQERTVGPGLGADSIAAGEIAAIIGLVLVIVFMAIVYGMFGAIADVALITSILLIAGALSLLQATLTLPGIAGIVLTIGMAVDANVLIFERIREEVRSGRTPISAVDAGYRRALTTIIDSNVTTLIAAVLLFQFGSGPIRGFAVTLSIGILTSMFPAIMVTRLILVTWLRRRRPQSLPI
jgi:preprotein translocase subunit SecD